MNLLSLLSLLSIGVLSVAAVSSAARADEPGASAGVSAKRARPHPTPAAAAPATVTAAAPLDEAGSYSLGLSFANQWRTSGLMPRMSKEQVLRGIDAGLDGAALTPEDRTRASEFMKAAYAAVGTSNQAKADEFLARNLREAGVRSTPSGLQYQVLVAADPTARPAGPEDKLTVKYRGRFIDGTEFDSTDARGQPSVIKPSMVIQGWREALGLMGRGAKWRLFIPPKLGYGSSPPPAIPPNSLLIFEVEIIDVDLRGNSTLSPKPR